MELDSDMDKDFLLQGLEHGFKLFPDCANVAPAEMHNYFSATNFSTRAKVEATIQDNLFAFLIFFDNSCWISA